MFDYLIVFFSIIVINAIPAFMPPTWTVLFLLSFMFHIPIIELAIIGAAASSIGRYILAIYSGPLADRFLPKQQKKSVKYLKNFLSYEGSAMPFFVSFLYALGPLPSNVLFILVGAAHVELKSVLSGFCIGRLISYGVLVSISKELVKSVSLAQLFSPGYLLLDALGLFVAVAILFMDWEKLIKKLIEREKTRRAELGVRELFK